VSDSEPVAGTAARRARRAAGTNGPASRGERGSRPGTGASRATSRRLLDPDALAALEEERDFLLRSLEDLEREHDAGDVDDVDYEELKDDYTARAAEVLRSIESRQAAFAARRQPPSPMRRVVSIALVVVVAVLAGVAVGQASGRRGIGDEITGDIRQTARDKVLQARREMGEGEYLLAIETFDEVIEMSPSNVEARAYKGWLLTITARQAEPGEAQNLLRARAVQSLDRAVEIDPDYPDARIFRAAARGDVGQPAAGLDDLDALDPDDVPFELRPLVENLRARLAEQAGVEPDGVEPPVTEPADGGPTG
jgi:tetratricopeptide (TPR) repeat protein